MHLLRQFRPEQYGGQTKSMQLRGHLDPAEAVKKIWVPCWDYRMLFLSHNIGDFGCMGTCEE
jgi:hypothetical protein